MGVARGEYPLKLKVLLVYRKLSVLSEVPLSGGHARDVVARRFVQVRVQPRQTFIHL